METLEQEGKSEQYTHPTRTREDISHIREIEDLTQLEVGQCLGAMYRPIRNES